MKKRWVLFLIFALMVTVGLVLKETGDILHYARVVCLSCIGIE